MVRDPSMNGHRTRRPGAKAQAASADAEFAALLRQVALHLRGLFEKAGEFASLGWKRLKLRAADGVFTTVFVVAALLAAATTIVCAAQLAVAGIRHAVARLAGAEWVGELGGGLLALALPFLVLFVFRWRTRRTLLARALHPGAREAAPRAAAPTEPADDVARRDVP
jgi:hypothetical protein